MYLKWRLQKHVEMHTKEVKACKYFVGKQNCPFEKIGCMFSYEDFFNKTSSDDIEDISEESSEDGDDRGMLVDNQCHLCRK